MAYKWRTGSLAWLLHRITGAILTLYLFAHFYVLSSLKDPERFESIMSMTKNPLVKLGELGLLVVVAAHTLNGIRVTVLELGVAGRHQKSLFWSATALVLGIAAAGAITFFRGGH